MDQTALLSVITAFIIIAALALCIQAAAAVAMLKRTRSILVTIQPLVPKLEALLDNAQTAVEQSGHQVADIAARATDILESTKRQLGLMEEVVTDATARAHVQLERVEFVLDDTISRTHEAVAVLHQSITRPLRGVYGIAAGLRAALGSLVRAKTSGVDHVTTDEEIFI